MDGALTSSDTAPSGSVACGFGDEAGVILAGEVAGLQDPEWGFGMLYATESGALAA